MTNFSPPKFAHDSAFHRELQRRVREYFRTTGLSPRDSPRMYLKTAWMLAWFAASYLLLAFAASSLWQGMLLSASLVLAMAGIGFSVQHDANHNAYSRHKAINRLLGMSLDLLGASSYVWRWKHNVAHHTYPNVSGADGDIDLGFLGRLCPGQPRLRIHRLQSVYLWVLYGFLTPKWHFVYDFEKLARGRIGQTRIPRPRGWSLAGVICGKLLFFSWVFLIPALFHPWWVVLTFYALNALALGLVLSVVFQLAHCVEEAVFYSLPAGGRELPECWSTHQVRSSVDFASSSSWLTWYLGGLNFQIEHHLFPRVCHVHYPRIAGIVQAVCAEFGVPYHAHGSLFGALASHTRWLRRMGRLPDGA